jgi:hypothetical protein
MYGIYFEHLVMGEKYELRCKIHPPVVMEGIK